MSDTILDIANKLIETAENNATPQGTLQPDDRKNINVSIDEINNQITHLEQARSQLFSALDQSNHNDKPYA